MMPVDLNRSQSGSTPIGDALYFRRSSIIHWVFTIADAVTGSDNGDNFYIGSYSDAGSFLKSTLINRKTGNWTFPATITLSSGGNVTLTSGNISTSNGTVTCTGDITSSAGNVVSQDTISTSASDFYTTFSMNGTVNVTNTDTPISVTSVPNWTSGSNYFRVPRFGLLDISFQIILTTGASALNGYVKISIYNNAAISIREDKYVNIGTSSSIYFTISATTYQASTSNNWQIIVNTPVQPLTCGITGTATIVRRTA
jgi:hypothetical protein